MANRKLIDTDFAISLLEEYRIENPYKKVFAEDIARKANKYGFDIKGRILRRDKEFKKRLDEINKEISINDEIDMVAFKTFDVDKFVRNSRGTEALIRGIKQRDEYYKSICIFANRVISENRQLKKENASLAEIEQLKKRISQLNSFIDKYINPSIANELLRREGIINETSSIINVDVVDPITAKTKLTNSKLNKMLNMFDDEE